MEVPYTSHSYLIGPRGDRSKKISRETGNILHFPDINNIEHLAKLNHVLITGTLSSVDKGRAKLRDKTKLEITATFPTQWRRDELSAAISAHKLSIVRLNLSSHIATTATYSLSITVEHRYCADLVAVCDTLGVEGVFVTRIPLFSVLGPSGLGSAYSLLSSIESSTGTTVQCSGTDLKSPPEYVIAGKRLAHVMNAVDCLMGLTIVEIRCEVPYWWCSSFGDDDQLIRWGKPFLVKASLHKVSAGLSHLVLHTFDYRLADACKLLAELTGAELGAMSMNSSSVLSNLMPPFMQQDILDQSVSTFISRMRHIRSTVVVEQPLELAGLLADPLWTPPTAQRQDLGSDVRKQERPILGCPSSHTGFRLASSSSDSSVFTEPITPKSPLFDGFEGLSAASAEHRSPFDLNFFDYTEPASVSPISSTSSDAINSLTQELDVFATSAPWATCFDNSRKTALVIRTGTNCFVHLWCFEERRELTATLHAAEVGQWVSLRTDIGDSTRICSAARPLYETCLNDGVLLVKVPLVIFQDFGDGHRVAHAVGIGPVGVFLNVEFEKERFYEAWITCVRAEDIPPPRRQSCLSMLRHHLGDRESYWILRKDSVRKLETSQDFASYNMEPREGIVVRRYTDNCDLWSKSYGTCALRGLSHAPELGEKLSIVALPDPCGGTTVVGFFKSADATKVESREITSNVRQLKALVASVENSMVELIAFGGSPESHRLNTEAYRFKTLPKTGDWYDLTVQVDSVFRTPLVISATPANRTSSRPGYN
ncbi:protein bicaudal C [Aphelenchoides avenae]|nr:protein bicaudal C [Aphelenchus avenae]